MGNFCGTPADSKQHQPGASIAAAPPEASRATAPAQAATVPVATKNAAAVAANGVHAEPDVPAKQPQAPQPASSVPAGAQQHPAVNGPAAGGSTAKDDPIAQALAAAKVELEANAKKQRRFEDYFSISKLVGHGAFAKVCICHRKENGEQLAVKTVARSADDPEKQREGKLRNSTGLSLV
jgi:hypothetical protein